MEIVSATATRRDVFAVSPIGLVAVAASNMRVRIPVPYHPVQRTCDAGVCRRARNIAASVRANNRIATKCGFGPTNSGYIGLNRCT